MRVHSKKDKKIPLTVVLLGLVSLFTDAATEMIYPLIPVYVAALGSGAIVLGIMEGSAETIAALLKLFSGVLSDKLGKRKGLILGGYTLSSLVRPLTGMVSAAWQIIVIRVFDRVGKGLRSAPRDALISSVTQAKNRGRAYGFHRAMDHTGAVLGPVLAILVLYIIFSFLHPDSPLQALRWTFLAALVPGLLTIGIILFFIREAPGKTNKVSRFRFSLKNFNSDFKRYLLVMLLFTLGNSSDAFLLFRVEEAISASGALEKLLQTIKPFRTILAGLGDGEAHSQLVNILFLPLIWAFFHIIKVLFAPGLGALSDKVGRKLVIGIGWGIYIFVYLSFAVLTFLPARLQIPVTFGLFAIYALFYAFTEGAEKAFVSDLATGEQKGNAFGMFHFATGLGALPASLIFGFLFSFSEAQFPGLGGTVAFSFGACLALVALCLLILKVKEPYRRKTDNP